MKVFIKNSVIAFPFDNYCQLIFDIIPKSDTIGIDEIRFIERFSHPKSDQCSIACYLEAEHGNRSNIEINLKNVIKEKIPEYLFKNNQEIAALFLSEIISHEVGHHAHRFKRHGVKKEKAESFAEKYAKAGYFNYLRQRKNKILADYRRASLNVFAFDKKGRQSFSLSRQELINWINDNPNGIEFP